MLCFSNLIVPSVVCSVCRMAFSISVQLFPGIHSRKKKWEECGIIWKDDDHVTVQVSVLHLSSSSRRS
uniref:Putative secreted protein n=1 Tax=Anopheles marajoara TaxID=58244 RepID=A0A2M4CFL9_9DIPT